METNGPANIIMDLEMLKMKWENSECISNEVNRIETNARNIIKYLQYIQENNNDLDIKKWHEIVNKD